MKTKMNHIHSFTSFTAVNEQEAMNPENLKLGDKDSDPNGPVHKLQQKLINAGLLDVAKPTGYFGELTKKALEDSSKKWDAILVGGLDNRPGDYKIDQQVVMLKRSLGATKNVKGFRYNTETQSILNFLKAHPKLPIYLFSAGCNKAEELASSPNVDKNKIHIIEPYAASGNKSVSGAVAKGVPAKNVFVGPDAYRGMGVVKGASSSNAKSHWGSLEGAQVIK